MMLKENEIPFEIMNQDLLFFVRCKLMNIRFKIIKSLMSKLSFFDNLGTL